jgi:hypothetical protein
MSIEFQLGKEYSESLTKISEHMNLSEFKVENDGTYLYVTYASPVITKTLQFEKNVRSNESLRFLTLEERVLTQNGVDSFKYRWNAL